MTRTLLLAAALALSPATAGAGESLCAVRAERCSALMEAWQLGISEEELLSVCTVSDGSPEGDLSERWCRGDVAAVAEYPDVSRFHELLDRALREFAGECYQACLKEGF